MREIYGIVMSANMFIQGSVWRYQRKGLSTVVETLPLLIAERHPQLKGSKCRASKQFPRNTGFACSSARMCRGTQRLSLLVVRFDHRVFVVAGKNP
jgi:hypothetical protein